MQKAEDERQLFVPLGDYVQGEADGFLVATEPIVLEQCWAGGLLLVSHAGQSRLYCVLALKLSVPVFFYVIAERLTRGLPGRRAILHPALDHCAFLLPSTELPQLACTRTDVPALRVVESHFQSHLGVQERDWSPAL